MSLKQSRKFAALLIGATLLFPARQAGASGSPGLVVISFVLLPVTFPWLIAEAVHERHNVGGCVSDPGTGLTIRNERNKRDYALTGNLTGISANRYVELEGRILKNSAQQRTFQVIRLKNTPFLCGTNPPSATTAP